MRYRAAKESGIALMVVMLVMLIFTVMMLGFYFVTTGEQKIAASDRDNAVAYYGAVGALEKMSSDLAASFVGDAPPTPAQINALTGPNYQPTIPGITFPPGGYTIYYQTSGNGLASTAGAIPGNGPLQGLQGIITPFTLTVIADGPNDTEVKMTRQVQEVAVPVFQFGIFSQTDLSFFAGSNFGFGGRVHTNGNLFLAEGAGDKLTLGDRTTAYLNIIRARLSNGYTTASGSGYDGTVDQVSTAGGCPGPAPACRALAQNEGSVEGGSGSAANPNWPTLSLTTYNGYILTGLTGAKNLNLALALAGAKPIAMIERPAIIPAESPTSNIGAGRFFNQASLRILLSDTPQALTGFVNSTSNAPYPLAEGKTSGVSNVIQRTNGAAAYYLPATDGMHPPIAQSPGYASDNDYMLTAGTTLLGGYIKCEIQLNSSPGTWQDVTQEILSLGISRDLVAGGMTLPRLNTSSSGTPGLTKNTTYYYTVTAVLSGGAETTGTQASINNGTNKTVRVGWSAQSGALGYRVYRTTTPEVYTGPGNGYISVSGGSTSSYNDSNQTTPTAGSPPSGGRNISILHLEEARPGVTLNSTAAATNAQNFVPINMYDSREGEVRDITNSPEIGVSMNGVMNLVEIDVHNLQQWFAGTLCSATTVPSSCPSGALALNSSGYIVYFSDRRGNNNGSGETGQYGYEDTINPASGTGTPNGQLDAGEDVNGNGQLDTYGGIARPINAANVDTSGTNKYPTGSSTTLAQFMTSLTVPGTPNSAPLTRITTREGQKNPVLFFRRALRLVNGTAGYLPPLAHATCTAGATGGFTVAAENPIYIQGDYNASVANGFTDTSTACHVPAAVIGDAVTLLSDAWTPGAQSGDGDYNSFANPTTASNRVASTTYYRMAVMGGKNNSFPLPTFTTPAAPPNDFGTDGGTHNFLRYLENWSGQTLNYRGSLASFYISVQATGVYKCCNTVFDPPTRAYAFDTDFQNISSLPPGTPRFTDVNALSYQQALLASQ